MKAALLRLRDFAVDLVRRQPVRVVTGVLILVGVIAPGVIDQDQIAAIAGQILVVVSAGEVLRQLVFSPATVARMTRGARG